MRILEYEVSEQDQGKTLKTLVPRVFHLSTHAFRRLKVRGGILVNGESRHVSFAVKRGDRISVALETSWMDQESGIGKAMEAEYEERTLKPNTDALTARQDLIVYMDEDLLIVNKPSPLATLPGRDPEAETLREKLMAVLGPSEMGRYHPVNRLDKGTSGLLCIARHDHAQNLLTAQLHTGAFEREYLAVTDGVPAEPQGKIELPIAKEGTGARRVIREDGKPAVTWYQVIYTEGDRALVRLMLETGRTHQIRVHLAALGTPVAGDYLYGMEHPLFRNCFALHSARLLCRQPVTGEWIRLTAPVPDRMLALFDLPDQAEQAATDWLTEQAEAGIIGRD